MSFDIISFRHDVVTKAAAMTFKLQTKKCLSGFLAVYYAQRWLNPSSFICVMTFCCFCVHVCAVYLYYTIRIR